MLADFPEDLTLALPKYLAAQRWYAGSEVSADKVSIRTRNRLWSDGGDHELWHVIVGVGDDSYQLVLGVRPAGEPADFLHGHEPAVLGAAAGVYLYDAVWDSDLAKILLEVASGGREKAQLVRVVTAEQSNTSLVYDERLILKLFRRIRPGRNPDVDTTTALAGAGFDHVARPVLEWSSDGYDLAFGQEFLVGATEGWALALTSLRDLLTSGESDLPADAGGDFAAEAARLGAVTAQMHLALHAVFGAAGPDKSRAAWRRLVEGLGGRLEQAGASVGRELLAPAQPLLEHLGLVEEPGPAFRVHGDFHLGQVMRTDRGWYVLDFEGEPAKPVAERLEPASPYKDVAGMIRSFHYASRHSLVERAAVEWDDMAPVAQAWEVHNRQAFLEGYRHQPGISELMPDLAVSSAVLTAYEVDKALYELAYELAFRPEWVSIPLDAVERLVEGVSS